MSRMNHIDNYKKSELKKYLKKSAQKYIFYQYEH